MPDLGSPESRAMLAVFKNKKTLENKARAAKNKQLAKQAQTEAKKMSSSKGTQPGHTVTTSDNHTKPIKSKGRGPAAGPIGDIGGGGMNWETK